uniref:Uncharacterized protein n=1 Tax=Triticum urartu TaxID=4572 RepID=A0A8R7JWD9_TRIUA
FHHPFPSHPALLSSSVFSPSTDRVKLSVRRTKDRRPWRARPTASTSSSPSSSRPSASSSSSAAGTSSGSASCSPSSGTSRGSSTPSTPSPSKLASKPSQVFGDTIFSG